MVVGTGQPRNKRWVAKSDNSCSLSSSQTPRLCFARPAVGSPLTEYHLLQKGEGGTQFQKHKKMREREGGEIWFEFYLNLEFLFDKTDKTARQSFQQNWFLHMSLLIYRKLLYTEDQDFFVNHQPKKCLFWCTFLLSISQISATFTFALLLIIFIQFAFLQHMTIHTLMQCLVSFSFWFFLNLKIKIKECILFSNDSFFLRSMSCSGETVTSACSDIIKLLRPVKGVQKRLGVGGEDVKEWTFCWLTYDII